MAIGSIALLLPVALGNLIVPIERETTPFCVTLPGTNWYISISDKFYNLTHRVGEVWAPTAQITNKTHQLETDCPPADSNTDWSFSLQLIHPSIPEGYGTPRLLCVDFANLPCMTQQRGRECVTLTLSERLFEDKVCNRLKTCLKLIKYFEKDYSLSTMRQKPKIQII